jgi:hypothetical protein
MLCEVTSAKHSILYAVTSAKHAWVSLEKIWMGQMGRLEENIAAALLDTMHSFPLACLIFSRNLTPSDSQSCAKNIHTIHKLSHIIDCSPNSGIEISFHALGWKKQ